MCLAVVCALLVVSCYVCNWLYSSCCRVSDCHCTKRVLYINMRFMAE